MDEHFEVRDMRNSEWFWVHKCVMEYKGFSSSDKLVYMALCYFASSGNQKCRPSIRTLSMLTGLTKPTILKSLKKLEGAMVIKIDKREGLSSVYTLLKVSHLKEEGGKKETPVKLFYHPVKKKTTNNNNEQKNNNTKSMQSKALQSPEGKEINHLIGLFKYVNPAYERLFNNKTQRQAIERLLQKLGKETLEKIIKTLPAIFGKKYAPRITTPYALEQKLGDLIAYLKEERSKQSKIGIVK
jgi:hypothetical protein